MLKVGIIGVGTVGTSVANILLDNKNIISARAGVLYFKDTKPPLPSSDEV